MLVVDFDVIVVVCEKLCIVIGKVYLLCWCVLYDVNGGCVFEYLLMVKGVWCICNVVFGLIVVADLVEGVKFVFV